MFVDFLIRRLHVRIIFSSLTLIKQTTIDIEYYEYLMLSVQNISPL